MAHAELGADHGPDGQREVEAPTTSSCPDIPVKRVDDPAAKSIRCYVAGIHLTPMQTARPKKGVDNAVTREMTLDHRLDNHFPRRQR